MKCMEKAYAKVNLTLQVGSRRPDGYHAVMSVMQRISLWDTVTVERGTGRDTLLCSVPVTENVDDNLCMKAARAFFAETGTKSDGVTITLEKHIPVQAGLGGGSSDAAAVLREQIASRAPQVVEEYRLRLTERLARLPIEPVDPARLAQEVALMADKCAIDEELSRLESHIAQMHVYLDVSGETGKKMDFLIQEMNREANTIGSKCSDAQMAQNVVNLKSEIEKMREQIQNAV